MENSINEPAIENVLIMYVLYDKTTSDFPGEYIIRRHLIQNGESMPEKDLFFRTTILDKAYDKMRGLRLVGLGRHPDDDKVIIESFI